MEVFSQNCNQNSPIDSLILMSSLYSSAPFEQALYQGILIEYPFFVTWRNKKIIYLSLYTYLYVCISN